MPVNIFELFIRSLCTVFQEMADIEVKLISTINPEQEELEALGVVSVINFQGRIKGRVLIDMAPKLAITVAEKLMSEEYENERENMVLATVSEMNNIICGRAMAPINNELGLKLWMSPPYVFTGTNTTICISKIPSQSFIYYTLYGKVKLNIAFEREG